MTAELVVLAPVVLLFALMAIGLGRVEQARQELADAAQAGAEAASHVPTAGQATQAATDAATPAVAGQVHVCASPQVSVDTSAFEPGGTVRVTVACRVELSDLLVPGLPGSISLDATDGAPIDPYRATP
jgi:Flp pilus assembly protein TadG